jgi:SAM-dependent methyltransferase
VLFAELTGTSVVAPPAARAYVGNSFERLRLTVGLLPGLPPGARALELGANPYFLSRRLRRRGVEARAANWFGDSWPDDVRSQVVVESGVAHRCDFDPFDAERDAFPYNDGEFDLVLFCEVLEHLPHDPVHALREVHRVLRARGFLLLTTPNAARWDNRAGLYRRVMPGLIVGENCYVQARGLHDIEGIDGLPGRWTGAEARLLLEGDGAAGRLTVRWAAPSPRAASALVVAVAFDGCRCEWTVPCDGRPFERAGDVVVPSGVFEAVLSVAPTWSPAAVFGTADGRELGFVLWSMTLERGASRSHHPPDPPQ